MTFPASTLFMLRCSWEKSINQYGNNHYRRRMRCLQQCLGGFSTVFNSGLQKRMWLDGFEPQYTTMWAGSDSDAQPAALKTLFDTALDKAKITCDFILFSCKGQCRVRGSGLNAGPWEHRYAFVDSTTLSHLTQVINRRNNILKPCNYVFCSQTTFLTKLNCFTFS